MHKFLGTRTGSLTLVFLIFNVAIFSHLITLPVAPPHPEACGPNMSSS